jgi:hypothetical protein
MSEANDNGTEETNWDEWPPKMEDEALKELVLGVCDSRVFGDWNLRPSDAKSAMPIVFMPLGLGAFAEAPRSALERVGAIWEWLDKAGRRSINGYPSFMSMHVINKDDWERARAAIDVEMKRRKEIEI